jgi:hypothetical protein
MDDFFHVVAPNLIDIVSGAHSENQMIQRAISGQLE